MRRWLVAGFLVLATTAAAQDDLLNILKGKYKKTRRGSVLAEPRDKLKLSKIRQGKATVANAVPSTLVQGAQKIKRNVVTFRWEEPTTDTQGNPITNLGGSRLYRLHEGNTTPNVDDVAATTPQGGGTVSYDIDFGVPDGVERVIDTWATAKDTDGDESDHSNHVVLHVDRLAPAGPQ